MPIHEGETALFDHEFTPGRIYTPPRRSLAAERQAFIRYCAKLQGGGKLTPADVDDVVACFGGDRDAVIAEAKALGITVP